MLAWLVAALNIVHLLGPTLDLLDSVAVVVGGLRVSILTVVKGVLSLAMLLWVATVASNLFERRITRVSEITPRARVLLGKLLKATLVTLAVDHLLRCSPERSGSVLGWDYSGPSRTCSAGSFCCSTSRSSRAM